MKASFKKMQFGVKGLFCTTLLAASLHGIAQQRAVMLDPKLGQIQMADLSGNTINENYLQPGQLVKLVIPVASVNQNAAMPKGSCKIKIGLGSKLAIDPLFSLASVNYSNYFNWSVSNAGGQSQLTGELIADLPSSFQQVEVSFKVLGSQIGHSTITANFLITNHNTATILSDLDPSNNASFLGYEITNAAVPVPVTTINSLDKTDCNFKVTFSTDREIDLNSYEVEVSKNGTDFIKVYETNATNLAVYTATIAIPVALQAPVVYVRVKSIFGSGRIAYSIGKTLNTLCNGKWAVNMFPNPVNGKGDVVIKAISGIFDGKYTITLIDMQGHILEVKQVSLNNVVNFNYKISNVAAGKYSIKIVNGDASQSALLQFEKL